MPSSSFPKEKTEIKSRFATKEELLEFKDILKQYKIDTFNIWKVTTESGKMISEGACLFKKNTKTNKIRASLKLKRKKDLLYDHDELMEDVDQDIIERLHEIIDLEI